MALSLQMFRIVLQITVAFFIASGFSHATDATDLRAMIGQMILVGIKDTSSDSLKSVQKDIEEGKIGGVILFRYNIENPEQIKNFNKMLQSSVKGSKPKLFIALDQEGGKVQRLNKEKGFEDYPSHKAVAESYSPTEAYAIYEKMAYMIAEAGFNLNFAPSVDLNINPNSPIIGKLGRSFSADAKQVTEYAKSFIKAHSANKVGTSIKHFPGHGSSLSDSHLGFTDVTNTWSDIELEPFKNLIEQDIAQSVMTAHVYNAKIDDKYPATLSRKHLNILRNNLKFDGVIFTDDLQMKAVSDAFSLEEIVIKSVQAGGDVLVYSNFFFSDPEFPEKAISIIEQAVQRGEIAPSDIKRSYERILLFKQSLR